MDKTSRSNYSDAWRPSGQTIAIIQARMGSTRLPGKVLLPLAGAPLLQRQVERIRAAERAGTVVVAATIDPADDAIAELCRLQGIACFRGHPDDLLDRHLQAARAHGADAVVKIPSDCPLIDPAVIDRVIGAFLSRSGAVDYVSNLHPATYPDGNDVEVMTVAALETAWREAERPLEREHTTPFLWERPERFRLHNVFWGSGRDFSMSHRWTIDYPEDYAFIQAIYDRLYPVTPRFGLDDILALLEAEPRLSDINRAWAGVNWYRHHLDELTTVGAAQTRREPQPGMAP